MKVVVTINNGEDRMNWIDPQEFTSIIFKWIQVTLGEATIIIIIKWTAVTLREATEVWLTIVPSHLLRPPTIFTGEFPLPDFDSDIKWFEHEAAWE